MYKTFNYLEISRRITCGEYAEAVNWAEAARLISLDIEGYYF